MGRGRLQRRTFARDGFACAGWGDRRQELAYLPPSAPRLGPSAPALTLSYFLGEVVPEVSPAKDAPVPSTD